MIWRWTALRALERAAACFEPQHNLSVVTASRETSCLIDVSSHVLLVLTRQELTALVEVYMAIASVFDALLCTPAVAA